ncbi:Uncharacterized protein GBIM_19860 [Gryllus bimaculatus]|nr:Uncharacterized protein GBIM_19860 [Gryllus bimaculatus]
MSVFQSRSLRTRGACFRRVHGKYAFMAHVERDARARAAQRRQREAAAREERGAGDSAFAEGDFADALLHYTRAIDQPRRHAPPPGPAPAHAGRLRNCLRAWLLKARALFELDDEALSRSPHRKKDIDGKGRKDLARSVARLLGYCSVIHLVLIAENTQD